MGHWDVDQFRSKKSLVRKSGLRDDGIVYGLV